MNIKSIILTKEVKNKTELTSAIKKLKKEKNAVILAHYYQDDAIQEVADYLGCLLYTSPSPRDP